MENCWNRVIYKGLHIGNLMVFYEINKIFFQMKDLKLTPWEF